MNFAVALKSEIVRLARKELRRETQVLKKAASNHRSEIAALKRRVKELEQQVRRQARASKEPSRGDETAAAEATKLRFSAKGLAAHRKHLGLSAHDAGLPVGASGHSIYNWESGQVRPREGQLPAIAALRKIGRTEVGTRLEALRAAA